MPRSAYAIENGSECSWGEMWGSKSLGPGWSQRRCCLSSVNNLIRQKGGNLGSLWWEHLCLVSQAYTAYQLKICQNAGPHIQIFSSVQCGCLGLCKQLCILGISSFKACAWLPLTQTPHYLAARETGADSRLRLPYTSTQALAELLHWNVSIVLISFVFLGILS